MKIKTLVAAALVGAGCAASAATLTTPEFTLVYDSSTPFGFISSTFSSGVSTIGFTWDVPTAVQLYSFGGASALTTFALPSFTLTANPGYTLSGAFNVSLGNIVFNQVGAGATTSLSGTSSVSIDGSPGIPFTGDLVQTVTSTATDFLSGYYSGTMSGPIGTFNTLQMSGGSITLKASGGTFAGISAQPQNTFAISFQAQPVPEPQTYAMMLAGMATLGWMLRRRQRG